MKKDKKSLFNILVMILPIILVIMSIVFVVMLMKYAEVSLTLMLLIAVALFALIGLVVLGVVFGTFKSHNLIRNISLGVALVSVLLVGYGIYYLYNINASVDQIIVDGSEKETVTVAFVVYDDDQKIDVDDIKTSDKFGYIDNEAFQEGNVLALEEITNKAIDVKLVPYDTYNDLLLGLFNGEIDIAALPDNYYEMFIVNDGYDEYLDKTSVIHRYSKEVDTNGIDVVDKDITNEPFTLLIMGVDEERADTLILATFNPQRMIVTMTHIARDSFVPIACYRNHQSDKINHARAVSRSCMIETVENLMETEIDFFVEVNFKGVVDIVDALGGLWLTSPIEFVGQNSSHDRGTYNVWINEGYQLMDGEQVLAFARERHLMPDGDFTRQENQKAIIIELVSTLLETRDVNKALSVIKAAGSNISTNLSLNQMTQLLNFGFNTLTDTYVGERNGSLIFKVISTGLSGYESWTYNEGLQLPLWIYRPYQGSIQDNVDFINRNLEVNKTLKEYYKADFDILYPHYEPTSYVPDSYDEQEIHEKLPDFMPKMVRGKDLWTLELVNEWHATRTSINLIMTPVVSGDPLFNDAYQHHQIVYQSVDYGVKISNIDTLEVKYIQKDLDCSIEDNQKYFECSDNFIVPKFVGMSLNDANAWINSHTGKNVTIEYIDESSSVEGITYDQKLAGKIGAQSAGQYTKWDMINNNITLYYFNYPKGSLAVSELLSLNGETAVNAWFNDNWLTTCEINKSYDTSAVGSVIRVRVKNDDGSFTTLTSDTNDYRINRKIYITLSKGANVPNPLPDFVAEGKYLADFETYMSGVGLDLSGVTITRVDRPDASDDSLINKITVQSLAAGTTDYQLLKTIEITIYQ